MQSSLGKVNLVIHKSPIVEGALQAKLRMFPQTSSIIRSIVVVKRSLVCPSDYLKWGWAPPYCLFKRSELAKLSRGVAIKGVP